MNEGGSRKRGAAASPRDKGEEQRSQRRRTTTTQQAPATCDTCLETVSQASVIVVGSCKHKLCYTCCSSHLKHCVAKQRIPPRCPMPNCGCLLSINLIRNSVGPQCIASLNQVVSMIPEHLRFSCPYPACGALLQLEEQVSDLPSECPSCHRAVCSSCRSPWHAGLTCCQYQALAQQQPGWAAQPPAPWPTWQR